MNAPVVAFMVTFPPLALVASKFVMVAAGVPNVSLEKTPALAGTLMPTLPVTAKGPSLSAVGGAPAGG